MVTNRVMEAQSSAERMFRSSGSQAHGPAPDKGNQVLALVLLVGAFIYLVSPLDLIPDVIPLVCQVDDFGLLGMAVRNLFKSFR